MRDFYFFTNSKLTAADCYEQLKAAIPHIEMNGENDICINAKWGSYLWFNNETYDDFYFESPEDEKEYKARIPIKNPFVTDLESHRSIDVKRILRVLLQIHPELYVDANDEWFGTAQEYIDTEFDY